MIRARRGSLLELLSLAPLFPMVQLSCCDRLAWVVAGPHAAYTIRPKVSIRTAGFVERAIVSTYEQVADRSSPRSI